MRYRRCLKAGERVEGVDGLLRCHEELDEITRAAAGFEPASFVVVGRCGNHSATLPLCPVAGFDMTAELMEENPANKINSEQE